ncbi:conserved hypothetical protein [Ricinus communis]|uniref:Uncharacterized protein n=1 Tax=Ricinus communis TaxID=3988 RepID=B9T6H3_RICCO|nr:conserved hypothetical protein [Ricinus communis]
MDITLFTPKQTQYSHTFFFPSYHQTISDDPSLAAAAAAVSFDDMHSNNNNNNNNNHNSIKINSNHPQNTSHTSTSRSSDSGDPYGGSSAANNKWASKLLKEWC